MRSKQASFGRGSGQLARMRDKRRMRVMALLLAAVLALSTLLSAIVIARLHDHDCAGDDCAICHVLNAARVSLAMGAVASVASCVSRGLRNARAGAAPLVRSTSVTQTPVSLKVKLVI